MASRAFCGFFGRLVGSWGLFSHVSLFTMSEVDHGQWAVEKVLRREGSQEFVRAMATSSVQFLSALSLLGSFFLFLSPSTSCCVSVYFKYRKVQSPRIGNPVFWLLTSINLVSFGPPVFHGQEPDAVVLSPREPSSDAPTLAHLRPFAHLTFPKMAVSHVN
ncbi:hypothetical protein IWZ00DRAFT_492112 [Phyllosticta capitalensis]